MRGDEAEGSRGQKVGLTPRRRLKPRESTAIRSRKEDARLGLGAPRSSRERRRSQAGLGERRWPGRRFPCRTGVQGRGAEPRGQPSSAAHLQAEKTGPGKPPGTGTTPPPRGPGAAPPATAAVRPREPHAPCHAHPPVRATRAPAQGTQAGVYSA